MVSFQLPDEFLDAIENDWPDFINWLAEHRDRLTTNMRIYFEHDEAKTRTHGGAARFDRWSRVQFAISVCAGGTPRNKAGNDAPAGNVVDLGVYRKAG